MKLKETQHHMGSFLGHQESSVPWGGRQDAVSVSLVKGVQDEACCLSMCTQSCLTLCDPLDCSLPEPAHEIPPMTRLWGRKPDGQGGSGSGFQGFRKAAPSAHLKDDICLSDACFNRLLPNFCDTGRRPSPISSQIRINLEL